MEQYHGDSIWLCALLSSVDCSLRSPLQLIITDRYVSKSSAKAIRALQNAQTPSLKFRPC